jgi:hypothetical protein
MIPAKVKAYLLRKPHSEWGGLSTLDLMIDLNNVKLLEHPIVQDELRKLWNGKLELANIKDFLKMAGCLLCPFIAPSVMMPTIKASFRKFLKTNNVFK